MKTTEEQFKLFKRTHKHWVKKFGLIDYEIDYEYRKINPYYTKGYRAFVKYDTDIRYATVILYRSWKVGKFEGDKIPDSEVIGTAFHEACHLLFADLLGAEERNKLKEEHKLIAKLGSLLLKCS